ncbi:adenosylcobinamide-phosphate synthase CbiB [Candidatus Binatia bacterium]|nr:adenosylcobinamide-phosphate synthase CbiB [Candidatus Binatia bacterium]
MALDVAPSGVALLLALAWDVLLGEPPAKMHPVVWMGRAIDVALRLAPRRGAVLQLAYGVVVAVLLPLGCAALAAGVLVATARMPLLQLAVETYLLKSAFALRALGEAARAVRDPLARRDLPAARYALRSLCSRDAGALDEALVAAAAVESVAENASDSVVAPLLFYVVLGLPGALLYRMANTLDARIGYHGRYEWLGKPAARLDDALNLLPARATALLLLVAGWLRGCDVRRARAIGRRDARRTASPNAGHPMATMAGLLGVALEKPDAYRLGDALRPVGPDTIDEAWRLTRSSAAAMVVLALGAMVLRDAVL